MSVSIRGPHLVRHYSVIIVHGPSLSSSFLDPDRWLLRLFPSAVPFTLQNLHLFPVHSLSFIPSMHCHSILPVSCPHHILVFHLLFFLLVSPWSVYTMTILAWDGPWYTMSFLFLIQWDGTLSVPPDLKTVYTPIFLYRPSGRISSDIPFKYI